MNNGTGNLVRLSILKRGISVSQASLLEKNEPLLIVLIVGYNQCQLKRSGLLNTPGHIAQKSRLMCRTLFSTELFNTTCFPPQQRTEWKRMTLAAGTFGCKTPSSQYGNNGHAQGS